ncbi:MAG: hypothetical protein IJ733_19350 [Lachnospiraceae bacterium]|nr:hypothetical protein [Lachnospiraceae bacterium]
MTETVFESKTPYDDVCRTLLLECDDLVLPLINEIFGEGFSSGDRVIRRANEHYMEARGGAEGKRITDGLLSIVRSGERDARNYHIECESTRGNDGTMLIRIFEYAAQIALDDGEVGTAVQGACTEQVILRLTFPNSALICLRSKRTAAGQWRIHLQTPGGECGYEVPVMHIRDYTAEELFAKKLYFLIPFYLFNLEKELPAIDEEEKKLEDLKDIYGKILEKLSEAEEKGEISTFSFETLKDMTVKVAYHLAEKQEQVKKGIGEIMGGEVLDFEAKRIRDAARMEGRMEGRAEGRMEGRMEGRAEGKTEGEGLKLIKQVYIKRKKGQKPEVIAEALEEKVSYIKKICVAIEETDSEFGAEFDAEQVYHKIKK